MPDAVVRGRGCRRLCVALLVVLAACGDPPAPPLPPGIDAQHYDLTLRLDPATQALQARLILDVRHPDSLTTLPLALDALTIDTVRVNGRAVVAERRAGRLYVPLPAGRGASQIEVVYHGTPRQGLYTSAYGAQQVVYTDSWPDKGSGWLPGLHHPADPATFALRLTIPLGYEAAASGTLQALDTLGAEVRSRWQLDVPTPIYAFAFAVADFSLTEDAVADTLPVRYYMLAEDSARAAWLRRTPQALAFFSDVLGPYAFAGYASVQVPMRYAGMENAAASFIQADLFQSDEAGEAEAVQLHELAHQWFGNRVPIADWSDLWLSEGAATYLTTLFYEQADGLDAARRRWVAMAALSPIRRRTHTALVMSKPLPPDAYLTWVPYDKGASVLHLLRLTLGDEAFFAALRATYRRFAGRSLSTGAFRQRLEEEAGRDLAVFFDYWVYGDDLPTLKTGWNPATRILSWEITGDAGLLAGVPFDLQLRQRGRVRYVEAEQGVIALPDWDQARPEVRPVGVMMRVE